MGNLIILESLKNDDLSLRNQQQNLVWIYFPYESTKQSISQEENAFENLAKLLEADTTNVSFKPPPRLKCRKT